MCYLSQELEDGLSSHQPCLIDVNQKGEDIVQRLRPSDASFLKDKLASLNQRWSALVAEVKDLQPR